MPPNAVIGGNDSDGSIMYVGRSFHNGDMLVAKVIPSKHIAFVSWRGEEFPKSHFEVLCGQNLVWRHCYDHVIPANAVLCGETSLGQAVYIGRGHYERSLTVGKVSSVHRALFIPFGGVERRLETYEILVEEQRATGWAVAATPPPPAVCEKPFPPMDIKPAVCMPTPSLYPAVLEPPPVYTPSAPCFPPPPPPYAQAVPSCPQPQTSNKNIWVAATSNYTPPNAVHAGHDSDGSTIFVCRAFHNGDLIPGKAMPSRGCAYIPYAGQEIHKTNFEILVGHNYHWVHASAGNAAAGAVEAGRTATGEPLYVGRAHHCGSVTPGKIQFSHHCLYIPYGGREIRVNHYEMLVRKDDYYRDQALKMQC